VWSTLVNTLTGNESSHSIMSLLYLDHLHDCELHKIASLGYLLSHFHKVKNLYHKFNLLCILCIFINRLRISYSKCRKRSS
jgi:hypothetical protein